MLTNHTSKKKRKEKRCSQRTTPGHARAPPVMVRQEHVKKSTAETR